MLTDALNTFALAEATGNTGTRAIGDVMDLSEVPGDIGAGRPMYFYAQVDTEIEAGAGGTIVFQLVTADNDALTTNAEILFATAALDAATGVAAGTVLFNVALPSRTYRRYLGVREVVAVENTTAGKIDALLTEDLIAYRAYPQAEGVI